MAVKAVCDKKCFIRVGEGKARFINKGEVVEFPDKKTIPDYFRILSGPKPETADDLGSASEQELREGPYKIAELRAYAEKNFGVKLKGKSKEEVVDSFLDARYRYLEEHETEGIL